MERGRLHQHPGGQPPGEERLISFSHMPPSPMFFFLSLSLSPVELLFQGCGEGGLVRSHKCKPPFAVPNRQIIPSCFSLLLIPGHRLPVSPFPSPLTLTHANFFSVGRTLRCSEVAHGILRCYLPVGRGSLRKTQGSCIVPLTRCPTFIPTFCLFVSTTKEHVN